MKMVCSLRLTNHCCSSWLIEVAEDYYGNDYPEDELDSDDEYDRNTYRHWQSAFDEEELDADIDWFDEETHAKNTWKSC